MTGALQSQSPGAASYYLSTPCALASNAQWEFFVNLKFSTSGANYAAVYLMSDAADLSTSVNGYFVRIGGTADRIELFRSDAGTATSLAVQSPDAVVNSSTDNPFLIRVKRDAFNVWTLEYDDGALGAYLLAGSLAESTYATSAAFGIRIEQSTAVGPINNHFFDDLNVAAIPLDLTAPTILTVVATSATNVDVQYDEPLDAAFIGAYDIIPFIGVSAQVIDGVDPALVHVTPTIAFANGNSYTLNASAAQDPSGNVMLPASINFSYVVPTTAGPRDVVINEIMADPTPVIGLPDAEFIELYNSTTSSTFDLSGWTFTDGSTTATLPAYLLGPGQFVILTDDANLTLFTGFTNVIGATTFPSLNNDGDPLELKNGGGASIDAVAYDLSWYQDAVKSLGGWTLEQIDPTRPCSGADNWIASNDASGGTPGSLNSVFAIDPDVDAPTLLSVQVNSATELDLVFSEQMDQISTITGLYSITPAVAVASVVNLTTTTVRLTLASPLAVGQFYSITVSGVADCPGNLIGATNTADFALPEAVAIGDVVINEVLYDPRPNGFDFVELVNRSNKVLSLAGWKMAHEVSGAIVDPVVITSASVLLLPGEYIALSSSTANIELEYPLAHSDRLFQATLPSYNNGSGTVVLQAPDGSTLELFRYDDNMHFALLNYTEGVSLERVDPDRPSDDNSNWHSAAEAAGWATPGYENSQYSPTAYPSGELTIEPAIFSPDNDGFEDVLNMAYSFDQPGFTGSMTVFDLAGREVVKLMENELLGTTGAVSWDGMQADATLARIGPYVVYFEVFDLSGATLKFRKTVVVAQKLN